jgi:CHAT domain-containing protein
MASGPEDVAARVVDLFVLDDLARLDATVSKDQDLRARLDELECISVQHVTWDVVSGGDAALTLRVDVDASGTTTAASRPEARLPRTWYVDAERVGQEWRIVRLLSAERRLAKAMLEAPTTGDAECLFAAASDLSASRIVEYYADEIDEAGRSDRMPHAQALAATLEDPATTIAVLRLEATLLARRSDPAAVDVARRALELARRAGSADDVADATFALAIAYMLTRDTRNGLEHFAAAADMIERLDYPIMAMKALHMYGWLAGKSGMLLDVLRTSERLKMLARRYRWPEGEIVALFEAASVHYSLGNEKPYVSYIEEARRLAVNVGHRANIARFDFNRAQSLRGEGTLEAALALMRNTIANAHVLPRTDLVELYVGYAYILMDLGHSEEAEEALAKAESFAAVRNGSILIARASLELARGRFEMAVQAARAAVESERDAIFEIASMERLAQAFAVMGGALRRSGRTEEAIEAFRSSLFADEQSVAILGSPLRPTTVDRMPAYVDLIELLVARDDVTEALRVAERMRARSLRDALERGHVDLSATMTDGEREREQALKLRLAVANRARLSALSSNNPRPELDAELHAARIELDRFQEEMRVAHPTFARRQPPADRELKLPDGSESLAMIEYVVARTQTIAFVLTAGANGSTRVAAVPIAVSAADLERRASELAALMAGRSVGHRPASRRMHDLLLAPLEKHLQGRGTICIIPDGPLWSIPFQALVARDGSSVIDHRAVFYASSLALLQDATARPPRVHPKLIAFGNPTVGGTARATVRSAFRDVPLGPLIDAENEALAVSRMYGAESRAYVRDEAREEVFKNEAPEFGIVHIAAHAIVDHRAPMYSAIVLAAEGDDASEDGLLEGREVVDLPLRAELAVLSACDTARGKAGYGDGVIGLGWAFQAAGTPTLVVSQWQAESRVTSELMIELHRRLRAGATIAEALRHAQLLVRRRYPHPFYWAPFVAVGAAAKPVAAAQ